MQLQLSPCFCNDFRCYICWGPADSVEGSVHHGRQTKVSQFEALAAICMFVHLNTQECKHAKMFFKKRSRIIMYRIIMRATNNKQT